MHKICGNVHPTNQNSTMRWEAGYLLIRAMRQWFDGRRNWHLVQRDFKSLLGPERGADVEAGLITLLDGLSLYANRPLKILRPGSNAFGLDEILIHQAIAASQQSQFTKMNLLVEQFTRTEGYEAIADSLFLLTRSFLRVGFVLPLLDTPLLGTNAITRPAPQLRAAE